MWPTTHDCELGSGLQNFNFAALLDPNAIRRTRPDSIQKPDLAIRKIEIL
jgi:hypothetical protein